MGEYDDVPFWDAVHTFKSGKLSTAYPCPATYKYVNVFSQILEHMLQLHTRICTQIYFECLRLWLNSCVSLFPFVYMLWIRSRGIKEMSYDVLRRPRGRRQQQRRQRRRRQRRWWWRRRRPSTMPGQGAQTFFCSSRLFLFFMHFYIFNACHGIACILLKLLREPIGIIIVTWMYYLMIMRLTLTPAHSDVISVGSWWNIYADVIFFSSVFCALGSISALLLRVSSAK